MKILKLNKNTSYLDTFLLISLKTHHISRSHLQLKYNRLLLSEIWFPDRIFPNKVHYILAIFKTVKLIVNYNIKSNRNLSYIKVYKYYIIKYLY